MEKGRSPKFGDCGDYSTTVINCNNLGLFDLKMRSIYGAGIADKYMIASGLAITRK
jgi:hypothetical protein